jgi:hypothetical protein
MRLAHGLRLLIVIAAATAAATCTKVIETVPFEPPTSAYAPTPCHSALGYYFLPQALLVVSANSDSSQSSAPTVTLSSPPVTIADRLQAFCLDYLASPTSIDVVSVDRSAQGLLQRINSNVEDRTPAIAQALIQTAENFAIAAGRGTPATSSPVADSLNIQIDPFSWNDLMLAKKSLRRFGFCLYVEGFSFDTTGLSAREIRKRANAWCSKSADSTPYFENPIMAYATLPVSPEAMRGGVLYRPKTTHKIVLMRKTDPTGPGSWELYQTKRFDLPNASPILSIGIERALFTTRTTTVNFNDGTLTDVAIDKDSEAVGFVAIPLTVAKAITDVPAQILQLRLADTQSQIALVNAQGNLLKALRDYNSVVNPSASGVTARSTSVGSTDTRSGQLFGACLDASNGNVQACDDFSRGGSGGR